MYTPPKFKVDDPKVIREFIEQNSFGILLSTADGRIYDTHTPFVLSSDGTHLLGHIARANPQWKSWSTGSVAKVIFTGPHAYISPRFYVSEFAVPTWNYAAVSIEGAITVIEEEPEILNFLEALAIKNEGPQDPWIFDREDERYLKLLSGIVVFSVSADSVEGCFKLNQNRSEEDQVKVISSLSESGCPFESEMANLMTQNQYGSEQDAPLKSDRAGG